MIFGRNQGAARAALTALALVALSSAGCKETPQTNSTGAAATNRAQTARTPTVTIRRGTPTPERSPTLADLQPLSAFILNKPVQLLDGKTIRLADYKGKVVVLDIWATWCGPCREEIPHLIELGNEYASRGVEVIGLTTEDPVSDLRVVKEFVEAFKINYKIGWIEHDMASALANGRNSIPQTFVITRDGRLLKHFVGFNPGISLPKMREAIEMAVNM